jgi:tetratricopeptide (TPR) repeat protein
MSYTLFLLLNVNHDPEDLLRYIGARIEQTGETSFCLDHAPDTFFSVEYLAEAADRSLCIDIPFGAEESVLREVLDFLSYIEERVQAQVLDPQLGRTLKSAEAGQIIDHWKKLNLQALENYSDGHHFLRNVEERDGRKTMIEAIRFVEETWQNHCSVALAYNRVGHAAEARNLFERALKMDSQNAGILYALAVTCFNLRDFQKCREYLAASLAAEPDNPGARELLQDCEAKLSSASSSS